VKSPSPKLVLVCIGMLFLLPLLLAVLTFQGKLPFRPAETRNLGLLVEPPVPLEWQNGSAGGDVGSQPDLKGHWVILFDVPDDCSSTCLEAVSELRQIHRATGRDIGRVRVVLVVNPETPQSLVRSLSDIYPAFGLLVDETSDLRNSINAARNLTVHDAHRFLVDPLGQIMMTYNDQSDGASLSKDLKRLLKWSKQDENL
jgi:cytochrome oxidase Cu insertion factor (SCO1/SenC/PrrC family)